MFVLKAKKILIWTLAASFLVTNFFLPSSISRVKSQNQPLDPTQTATFDGGATWRDSCIKNAENQNNNDILPKDAPTQMTLEGEGLPIPGDNANVQAKLKLKNTIIISSWVHNGEVYKLNKWGSKTTIVQTVGAASPSPSDTDHNIGSSYNYSAKIPLAPGAQATFRAKSTICWETTMNIGADQPMVLSFSTEIITNNVDIRRPASGGPPTTTTNGNTESLPGSAAGAATAQAANTAGESDCEKQFKCENPGLFSPFRGSVCRAQCSVIDAASSMIGWLVEKVLYPALGLQP